MPLAEEGYLSVPPVALRATLAKSARFRTVVGSASEDAAKEHIYLNLAEDEEQEGTEDYDKKLKHPRPRAIVTTMTDFSRNRGGPGHWTFSASLLLSFEFKIPDEYRGNHNDEFVWFNNQVGAILSEMETARDASTSDILPFSRLVMVTDPMPCYGPKNIDDFWGCELQFFWI